MNSFKSKYVLLFLLFTALVALLALSFVLLPISKYPLENEADTTADTIVRKSTGSIAEGASSYLVTSLSLEVPVITSIPIPEGYQVDLMAAVPNFIKVDGNQLVINASKTDIGDYQIFLQDPLSDLFNETFYMELSLGYKAVDTSVINAQIKTFLGSEANNYGVFVYDLNRDISFGFNEDTGFRAASMVKVPIAIAIMREIEEGRLSLDTVYPLRADLIFNDEVGAGSNPIGSNLTVRDYLNYMIKESDNTSLSHLDALLGETYGSNENARIKEITGVDFFVYPPEATPRNVATVLKGLYSYSFLSPSGSEYIINLMKSALFDLKQGIGLGLPAGTMFANKIGFLDTDQDLSFMDSAIVYGETTDYVVVIMDRNQNWDFAQSNIKIISSIIYNNLN